MSDPRSEARAELARHGLERSAWVLNDAVRYGWPEDYLPEMARWLVRQVGQR